MTEEVRSHNPFAEGLRQSTREADHQLAVMKFRRPNIWHRAVLYLDLRARTRWLDGVLVLVPSIFIASSAFLFWRTYPWSSGDVDFGNVVTACASLVAVVTIILTAVTLPFTRAADFGPGFTIGLLRRPAPWFLGLAIAPLTTFLFWLATLGPDRDAAVASSLLAGGLFGFSWAMSRSLIGGADSLSVATQESKRIRKDLPRAIAADERKIKALFDRSDWPEVLEPELERSRAIWSTTFCRQLASAARRCFADGRGSEGLIFWDAMEKLFAEVAMKYAGAIGNENQLPGVMLESASEFAVAAALHGDDFAACKCVAGLSGLLTLTYDHPDAAKARFLARAHLLQHAERYWTHDTSRVATTAIDTLAASIGPLMRAQAREDAEANLRALVTTAQKAFQTQRLHIETVAVDGVVKAFPSMALVSDPAVRSHCLSTWAEAAQKTSLSMLHPQTETPLYPALDMLLPGATLGVGIGLQHRVTDVLIAAPALFDEIVDAIAAWLDPLLPRLVEASDLDDLDGGPITRALDLLLYLSLQAVELVARGADVSSAVARIADSTSGWLGAVSVSHQRASLRALPLAEILWSTLLGAACAADAPDLLRTHARKLASMLPLDEPLDDQLVGFVAGLAVAAGADSAAVDQLTDSLSDAMPSHLQMPWSITPRLGRALACTPRSVEHYTSSVVRVNAWALDSFPILGPR